MLIGQNSEHQLVVRIQCPSFDSKSIYLFFYIPIVEENGFSPFWNEGCEFDIVNPDLALIRFAVQDEDVFGDCLLYTSPSPRDATLSRMPSSA